MEPKPREPGPDSTRGTRRRNDTQDNTRPDNKKGDEVPLETYERSSGRGNDDPRTNPSQPSGAERTARDEP